jgi:hypothetical protein
MLAEVSATSIVTWSLILVAFIVAGWVTVWQVRRRLTGADETAGTGFTLSDLRRLHKTGKMSDEEFERAKAQVVDSARRMTAREAAAAAGKQPSRLPQGPEHKP